MKILLVLCTAALLSTPLFAEEPTLPAPPLGETTPDVAGSEAPVALEPPPAPTEAPAVTEPPKTPDVATSTPPEVSPALPPPPQAVPAAPITEAPIPASTDNKAAEEEDYDPRVPRYHSMRPAWAFQLSGSLKAFGAKDIDARQSSQKYPARSFGFSPQYQPTWLQRIGVISFGPTFAIYPISSDARVTDRLYSIYGLGGQIQYQLRVLRNQWIVPYAGYAAESLAYNFNNGIKGRSTMKGPYFGGYLNLNIFEPGAAADFYANQGVLRSYIYGELRTQDLTTPDFSVAGKSLYFGIRIEML